MSNLLSYMTSSHGVFQNSHTMILRIVHCFILTLTFSVMSTSRTKKLLPYNFRNAKDPILMLPILLCFHLHSLGPRNEREEQKSPVSWLRKLMQSYQEIPPMPRFLITTLPHLTNPIHLQTTFVVCIQLIIRFL